MLAKPKSYFLKGLDIHKSLLYVIFYCQLLRGLSKEATFVVKVVNGLILYTVILAMFNQGRKLRAISRYCHSYNWVLLFIKRSRAYNCMVSFEV